MRIPVIHGYIDRRILINYTADPKDIEKIIPQPFVLKYTKKEQLSGFVLSVN